MANSVNPGDANYISAGTMGLEDVLTVQRKYDLSDKIVSLDRATAPFDYRLRAEARKAVAKDPEPKTLIKGEHPLRFVTVDSSASTIYENDTLYLADADARWLQGGDVLMVPQLYCNELGTAYSTQKFGQAAPETVIVQDVVLSGKSANVAKVTVIRGNGNSHAAPGSSTVTAIGSSYVLVWNGNSIPSGGNAVNPRSRGLESEQNYLQFYSVVTGEDEQYTNTDLFGKQTFEKRMADDRTRLLRQIEFGHFWGRKAKRQVAGKTAWMTGGIVEYVPDASTALDGISRRINLGTTFSVGTFRKHMEYVFKFGNMRRRKWAFVGGKFMTELETYMEKFLVLNDSITKALKINVLEIETNHGILELMRHSMFDELASSSMEYAADMIVVDPDYVELMVLQNMDLKVRMNIQDPRAHTKEAELYGQLGLARYHPTAHAIFYGLQESF